MKKLSQSINALLFTPKRLAIALVIILFFWLFIVGDHKHSLESAPEAGESNANSVSKVQIQTLEAKTVEQNLVAQGQLLPWRRVSLKAEVAGRVMDIHKNQGDKVLAGETVLTLSDEGRSASLKQAKAKLESSRLELKSAKTLKSSKFVSETELSRVKADLAEAEANLEAARLAFDYGQPKAPFKGIVDRRHVEVGAQVAPGSSLFDIVQVDKLRLTAYIPQQKVGELSEGQTVNLSLLNGERLVGVLSFISAAADESTRSYYIEVTVVNPELKRIAGASATIKIPLESKVSHSISPALLSLDKNGKPGVFIVNDDNVVEYYSVDILSVSDNAIVSGLPNTVRLITIGSGFVKVGQTVEVSEITQ
jgi:multidrug efflux system membrane fusion protein